MVDVRCDAGLYCLVRVRVRVKVNLTLTMVDVRCRAWLYCLVRVRVKVTSYNPNDGRRQVPRRALLPG